MNPRKAKSATFRAAALVMANLLVAACARMETPEKAAPPDPREAFAEMYGARLDERFALTATDITGVDPAYFRQEVAYGRNEPPGTIVVDPGRKFLYLVLEGGRALRYGVGVGREGLAWSGTARVGRKAEWPRWTPTAEMIRRDPERNAQWRAGMDGGLRNPLGPRALYLYEGERDTLYRIHGTTEPRSIGTNVSSGCIRMFNQDVIDLYNRVPVGSKVIVLSQGEHVEPNAPALSFTEGTSQGKPSRS